MSRAWRSVRYARTFRRCNAEQDVLVFHMGQVAAAAFHDALLRHGFSSHRTRGIGGAVAALQARLLSRPNMSEPVLTPMWALHKRTLQLSRLVHRYRQEAPATGRKIKVITILREPWAWYVSSFVRNFPYLRQELDEWWTHFGPPGTAAGLADRIAHFQSVANDLVLSTDAGMGSEAFAKQLRAAATGREGANRFAVWTAMRFVRPLVWFDSRFRPTMNVDVYRSADQIRDGSARLETDFADILVVRYECLGDSMDAVRTFLGTPTFRLRRLNATGATGEAKAVRQGLQVAASDAVRARLAASRYSRAFGYAAAE